jgi:hypothetical protein
MNVCKLNSDYHVGEPSLLQYDVIGVTQIKNLMKNKPMSDTVYVYGRGLHFLIS